MNHHQTLRAILIATLGSSLALAEDHAPATEKPAAPAAAPAAPAAPELDPAVVKTNSSFGFGFRTGRQFSSQTSRFGITEDDIDKDAFIKGLFEAFRGQEPSIAESDVNAAFTALQKSVQEREKAIGEENLAAGTKFLEENGKREGVITTESGLQYEIITKGEGETYKAPDASLQGPDRTQFMIKYTGTLIDGTEFDSSKGKTVPMGMSTVPGFKEALTTMPVGSTWKLFLKPDLAYGANRRSPQIGPNSTLIFEVTLEKINLPAAPPARRPTAVSPPVRVPAAPPAKEGADSGANGKKPAVVSPPVRVVIPQNGEAGKEPAKGSE